MPLSFYKWRLDNFFQPPPHMDLPRNLHDCYFFYYSTCKKINCEYRHEAAALGHEETCKLWIEGKCYNRQCGMRHMKIQKKRNATPCYWEEQPGGCRKPHCVFQHKAPKLGGNGTTGSELASTATSGVGYLGATGIQQIQQRPQQHTNTTTATQNSQASAISAMAAAATNSNASHLLLHQSINPLMLGYEPNYALLPRLLP